MILYYNKINYKITRSNKIHFLLTVIFIVNFAYFFGLIIANLNIYGNKNHFLFNEERKFTKLILINKINDLSNIGDKILIINSVNSLTDISAFIDLRKVDFLPITNNNFEKNKLSNLDIKAYKIIIFDNSLLIAKNSCLKSNFEQMLGLGNFVKIIKNNYFFYESLKVATNYKNDFSFYNSSYDHEYQGFKQFLIYDYEIFIRK